MGTRATRKKALATEDSESEITLLAGLIQGISSEAESSGTERRRLPDPRFSSLAQEQQRHRDAESQVTDGVPLLGSQSMLPAEVKCVSTRTKKVGPGDGFVTAPLQRSSLEEQNVSRKDGSGEGASSLEVPLHEPPTSMEGLTRMIFDKGSSLPPFFQSTVWRNDASQRYFQQNQNNQLVEVSFTEEAARQLIIVDLDATVNVRAGLDKPPEYSLSEGYLREGPGNQGPDGPHPREKDQDAPRGTSPVEGNKSDTQSQGGNTVTPREGTEPRGSDQTVTGGAMSTTCRGEGVGASHSLTNASAPSEAPTHDSWADPPLWVDASTGTRCHICFAWNGHDSRCPTLPTPPPSEPSEGSNKTPPERCPECDETEVHLQGCPEDGLPLAAHLSTSEDSVISVELTCTGCGQAGPHARGCPHWGSRPEKMQLTPGKTGHIRAIQILDQAPMWNNLTVPDYFFNREAGMGPFRWYSTQNGEFLISMTIMDTSDFTRESEGYIEDSYTTDYRGVGGRSLLAAQCVKADREAAKTTPRETAGGSKTKTLPKEVGASEDPKATGTQTLPGNKLGSKPVGSGQGQQPPDPTDPISEYCVLTACPNWGEHPTEHCPCCRALATGGQPEDMPQKPS